MRIFTIGYEKRSIERSCSSPAPGTSTLSSSQREERDHDHRRDLDGLKGEPGREGLVRRHAEGKERQDHRCLRDPDVSRRELDQPAQVDHHQGGEGRGEGHRNPERGENEVIGSPLRHPVEEREKEGERKEPR